MSGVVARERVEPVKVATSSPTSPVASAPTGVVTGVTCTVRSPRRTASRPAIRSVMQFASMLFRRSVTSRIADVPRFNTFGSCSDRGSSLGLAPFRSDVRPD
jgi:hypothetical protein